METNNTIMTPSEFTNFLDAGAILRVSADDWFLLKGPFLRVEKTTPGQLALFTPDFFATSNPSYWLPAGFDRVTTGQFTKLCEVFNNSPASSKMNWLDAELQNFHESFAQIKDRIEKGTLTKAVPVTFETSLEPVSKAALGRMLQHLLSAPSTLFVYGFWQNGRGTLGASPETLLRLQGTQLSTMALAGTSPKQDVQRTPLLLDKKELFEHDLVVQDIQQVLQKYGDVQLDGPQILELPTLLHLKTELRCEVRD
ncbi:MAG: isochorismate synthase, partial [Proteobacteria bacterium]